jgi:L-alanine-DL-glutamate epimerase-like enolase superfamily enzyme
VKIVSIQDMHVAGGVRGNLSFLKFETDEGIVGWSEYNEEFQSRTVPIRPGMTMIVRAMALQLIGADPTDITAIELKLRGGVFRPHYGLESYAVGCLVNGCLDIKAKALGLRVVDLFGGAVREELPVYWSHCGTYRAVYPDCLDGAPVKTLDDIRALGEEVRRRGFGALKTNELAGFLQDKDSFFGNRLFRAYPERVASPDMFRGIAAQLEAFNDGTGKTARIALDLNCQLRPADVRSLAHFLEPFNLMWLEIDNYIPSDLAQIRWSSSTPIGSGETILGTRDLLPHLQAGAFDVCIIDVQHNGLPEALRMASLADAFDVNVAAHNAYSGLSILFGAAFCASVPNFQIMEFDIDQPRWMSDILSHPPTAEGGKLKMPTRPGWGTDVLEEGVLAHPPAENPAAPWLLDYHRKMGAV